MTSDRTERMTESHDPAVMLLQMVQTGIDRLDRSVAEKLDAARKEQRADMQRLEDRMVTRAEFLQHQTDADRRMRDVETDVTALSHEVRDERRDRHREYRTTTVKTWLALGAAALGLVGGILAAALSP